MQYHVTQSTQCNTKVGWRCVQYHVTQSKQCNTKVGWRCVQYHVTQSTQCNTKVGWRRVHTARMAIVLAHRHLHRPPTINHLTHHHPNSFGDNFHSWIQGGTVVVTVLVKGMFVKVRSVNISSIFLSHFSPTCQSAAHGSHVNQRAEEIPCLRSKCFHF